MMKLQDHRIRVAASKREEMQNLLMFSALVLASEKSIHEIDVDDIIKRAEVSRGSFYKYFPSVQALVPTLANQLAYELTAEINTITQQIPSTATRLVMTSKLTMRSLVKFQVLGKFFIQLPWPSQSAERHVFKNISSDIELGIKEGLFTKMPASIGCNLLIGSLIGGIHASLGKPPSASYENKVLHQALVGLGLSSKTVDDLLKIPLSSLPKLPDTGLLSKVATLNKVDPEF
jgi:TetR/AcrR family transcriptional regulator, ethionamide resistance regulator